MVAPVNLVFDAELPGQAQDGTNVRFVRMKCGNTLAQCMAAGFLNPLVAAQGLTLYTSDFVFLSASDGNAALKPTFGAGGVITLAPLP